MYRLGMLLALMAALTVSGSSLSREKLVLIDSVCSRTYNDAAVNKSYVNLKDAKLKNQIKNTLKRQIKPFPARGRVVNISSKDRQKIEQRVRKVFYCRKDAEIPDWAQKRSEKIWPLYQSGDQVYVECQNEHRYWVAEGKYEKSNGDYVINGLSIPLKHMQEKYRSLFDENLNRAEREKSKNYLINNYHRLKKAWRDKQYQRARVRLKVNEKNGYIFFKGDWRQPDYVINFFIDFHQKRALNIQKSLGIKAPAPKKK